MRVTTLPSALDFEGTQITIIDRDGTPHLSARDLSRALGYADERAVHNIYRRNTREFTGGMTCVVKMTTQVEQAREVRIFSPRGAHLVAMFARTERAAAFRRWVLDVLEGLAKPQAIPQPDALKQAYAAFASWASTARSAMVAAGVEPPAWPRGTSADTLAQHAALAELLAGHQWLLAVDRDLALHLTPVAPGAAVVNEAQAAAWISSIHRQHLPAVLNAIAKRLD